MRTPQGIDSPERKQAAQIRKSLDSQIAALRAQKNLTREGRAARIAEAIEKTKVKLAEGHQAELKRLTDRQDELQKKLFGNRNVDDARIASIRDARDRAAALDKDPDKAAAAMTRADRDGDHILVKAYAEEAARRARNLLAKEHGAWAHMFGQWAAEQTGGTDAVAELQQITHELSDPGQRMVREAAFGIGVLPEEVRGVGNLKALAAQADQIPELGPTRAEQVGDRLAAFARGDGGGY